MASSSITGGQRVPRLPSGADLASLGPSDSSDSGSDTVGTRDRQALAGDSDAAGTGEGPLNNGFEIQGSDILPDHLLRSPDGAIDKPGSALDDPDLMDTTADVGDLAQDEAQAQDLDGFSPDEAQPGSTAFDPALPGHRGVQ